MRLKIKKTDCEVKMQLGEPVSKPRDPLSNLGGVVLTRHEF